MKFKSLKKVALTAVSLLLINSLSVPVFAAEMDISEGIEKIPNFESEDTDVYVEISNDDELFLLYDNSYEDTIGMTDEQALQIYNNYLAMLPKTLSKSDMNSSECLDEFVEYAIEQGIIENNEIQKAGITKAVVRGQFKTVATAGKSLGYKTAGTLLDHSLQDKPSNLSYGANTTFASQISKSSEYKAIVNSFKSYVKGKKLSARTTSGSTTLNSTTDLHLAYNRVSYVASGKKSNGVWTLTITFSDTYDFDKQAWKNAMTGNPAVTILNNYAAYAQSLKAIVPYKVKVTVNTTFRE